MRALSLLCLALPLLTTRAFAASDTWNGSSGSSGNWSDTANWGGATVASGDVLFFGGTTRINNTNTFSGYSFGALIFSSGAGAFSLFGNAFTLNGGITNSSTGTETINNNITLANSTETITNTTGSLILGGAISGAGSSSALNAILNTGGTLTILGNNSFSGGLTVNGFGSAGNQWNLTIGSANAFGTGTFTYSSGGNVRLTANGAYTIANNVVEARDFYFYGNNLTFAGSWTHNNSKTMTINNGLTVTLAGGLAQGANALFVSGSGTLALNGATTGSGGIFINGVTLSLGNAAALGAGTLTFSGGNLDSSVANLINANNNAQNWNSDFTFIGSQNLNLGTGAVTLNANRTVTVNANNLTIGGVVSGAFSLTKAGAGTLTLTATNTYSGGTAISNGTLAVIGSLGGGAVTVAGGTLSPSGSGVIGMLAISNSLAIQAGGTLAMDINKAAATNDAIVGLTSVIFGGTLVINNLSGTLTTNDSFKLFNAGSYSGAFVSVTPAPGPGLAWNTNTLATDGTLRIVSLAVPGDPNDYQLYETGPYFHGTVLFTGASSASNPGGRNAIYIFALPAISATNKVASATLAFNYLNSTGSPWFNTDLWGVGFYPSDQAITSCYLGGTTDTNAADARLNAKILTPPTAAGSVTSSNFAAYLNSFYTNNGGYAGGMYLFLRLNPDVEPGSVNVGYFISGAQSTNQPVLNIVTANIYTPPAPTNFAAIAANGQVALSWSPVAGVSQYHVKKKRFSGDAFTVIATTSATNFTDAGLINGPTCRYVVCSVNTNGEGDYSVEKLVIPFSPMTFVHPGLLHGQADLYRIKQMVSQGIEPWASGFIVLSNDIYSAQNYTSQWQPAYGTIDGATSSGPAANNDSIAAYQQALMWCITSNSAYAQNAIQILNNWSSSITNTDGNILGAGLLSMEFVNAAELMRYSNAGWAATNIVQFSAFMTNVFYPVIADFATFANGGWDAICEKGMAGIGIFCDRADIFECATNYYLSGVGNGALTNYIYPNGQCQESGREQNHTQLGLGSLAELCEMAWHQGVDLYGAATNRLLAGFEYTSKFNLGYDVPYIPANFTGWSNAVWYSTTISTDFRGVMRSIYEMPYNHYVNRRGLPAPFTAFMATNVVAPEGLVWSGNHPDVGTLLFSLQPRTNWANRIQAESFSNRQGTFTEACSEGGLDVAGIANSDYLCFASVNLTNIHSFTARIANGSGNTASINIILNDLNTGPLLGTCTVPTTYGWQNWVTVSCNLMPTNVMATNLFLVFQSSASGNLFNLNWFCLNQSPAPLVGVSNVTTFLTGAQTPVNIGAQPSGMNWFGGETVGNNSLGTFPVGTNYVMWFSTNSSGYVSTVTQTVVVAGPPKIASALSPQQLQMTWPALYTGWHLQAQTNRFNSGLGTNWTTLAGSDATNQITISVATTNASVFYRLVYP